MLGTCLDVPLFFQPGGEQNLVTLPIILITVNLPNETMFFDKFLIEQRIQGSDWRTVERPGPAWSHGDLLSSDGDRDPGWRCCWGSVYSEGLAHDSASTALLWLRRLAEVKPETQWGRTEHAEQGF